MSVYLPAGSLERTVSFSPDVNVTDVLSSLTVSVTSDSPCLAVTPLRSLPSVDFTVSLAPGSSSLPPPVTSFLLTVAVMSSSVISTESTSFSFIWVLPSSVIVKSIAVAFTYPRGAVSSISVYLPAGSLDITVDCSPDVNVTECLSSLTVSSTSLTPCTAVTPLRSRLSLDFTVSLAPASSLAVPPLISFLLTVAEMSLSVISTEATSFSLI